MVDPGYFRTNFLVATSIRFADNRIGDYEEVRDRIEAAYRRYSHRQPGDPTRVGSAIVQLVNTEAPPRPLLLGSDAVCTNTSTL